MRLKSFVTLLLFVTLAGFQLASCAPDVEDPGIPNALIATPDTVTLVSATASKQVSVRLQCGCGFKLDSIIAVSGDLNTISVTTAEPQTTEVSNHTLIFAAKVGTPSGTYAADYLLKAYSYSARAFLPAPVHVTLSIP